MGEGDLWQRKRREGGWRISLQPAFPGLYISKVVWKQTFLEHTQNYTILNKPLPTGSNKAGIPFIVGLFGDCRYRGVPLRQHSEAWDAASDTNSEVPEETTDAYSHKVVVFVRAGWGGRIMDDIFSQGFSLGWWYVESWQNHFEMRRELFGVKHVLIKRFCVRFVFVYGIVKLWRVKTALFRTCQGRVMKLHESILLEHWTFQRWMRQKHVSNEKKQVV